MNPKHVVEYRTPARAYAQYHDDATARAVVDAIVEYHDVARPTVLHRSDPPNRFLVPLEVIDAKRDAQTIAQVSPPNIDVRERVEGPV